MYSEGKTRRCVAGVINDCALDIDRESSISELNEAGGRVFVPEACISPLKDWLFQAEKPTEAEIRVEVECGVCAVRALLRACDSKVINPHEIKKSCVTNTAPLNVDNLMMIDGDQQ
jgi:hypothetical protein